MRSNINPSDGSIDLDHDVEESMVPFMPQLVEDCMKSVSHIVAYPVPLVITSQTKGRTLNGCLTGQSKITKGYDLPA